jgi:hypothetical protein
MEAAALRVAAGGASAAPGGVTTARLAPGPGGRAPCRSGRASGRPTGAGARSATATVTGTDAPAGGSIRVFARSIGTGGRGGPSIGDVSWMAESTSVAAVVAVPAIATPFAKRCTRARAVAPRRSLGQPTIH